MTRFALALIAVAFAACTTDVHLGSRTTACDPFDGPCPCSATAECPANYYCIQITNTGTAVCQPPAGCTALPMGGLDCPNAACNPADSNNCDPTPVCMANVCSNTGDTCCAAELRCYPATCLGCCE